MGRHTRDLIRACVSFSTPGEMKRAVDSGDCTNYTLIKQHAQKQKNHKCTGDSEYGLVERLMNE